MRYQNKQRYPPIATAKPLPTLSQRGTAATATEIAKDTANDENEPPPGHRSDAYCSRPPPMPGERRQNAHHRACTPAAEFFSRADGLDDDGLAEIRAQSHHGSRLGPGIPRWNTTGPPADASALAGSTAHRTSNRSNRTFPISGEEVPGRHVLGGDRHHAGNPTRAW